jgi:hypothetical protein
VMSQTTMTRTAPQNAQALPSNIDERRAKDRNASLTTQKISRSFSFFVLSPAPALFAMSLSLSRAAADLRAPPTCSSNGQAQSALISLPF